MTVSSLNLLIETKLYELFNKLLHHGSYKSKRLTEKIKDSHNRLQIYLN